MAVPHAKVLLSGGIGTGKSTLARFLRLLGAHIIDADQIGHEVLDHEARDQVVAAWPEVAAADGSVDRARLAGIVFADSAQLERLEGITHPAIGERLSAAVDAVAAQFVVVELPIDRPLAGPGWVKVAIVGVGQEEKLRRLVARGMTTDDARARMASQPTDEEWTDWADVIVANSGTEKALEVVAGRLVELLEDGIPKRGRAPLVVSAAS